MPKRSTSLCLQVEMYADPVARGGVLEPEGIVEIKFRVPDLLKAMHRLDPVIRGLKEEAAPDFEQAVKDRETALLPVYRQVRCSMVWMSHVALLSTITLGPCRTSHDKNMRQSVLFPCKACQQACGPSLADRMMVLMGAWTGVQMAVAFAEMHDTPVRMVAKGVLHGIVPWSEARPFLASRLRRR